MSTSTKAQRTYVFVGTGPAGGTAAGRLGDKLSTAGKTDFKIIVFEAGSEERTDVETVPAFLNDAAIDPITSANVDVFYHSESAHNKKSSNADPKTGTTLAVRGFGPGGGSRNNALNYVHYADQDWEERAIRMGDPTLRAKEMNRHMNALESGPLPIRPQTDVLFNFDPALKEFSDCARRWVNQNIGDKNDRQIRAEIDYNPNHLRAQGTVGLVKMPSPIDAQGHRVSARDILEKAIEKRRANYEIIYDARVSRVVFEERCAFLGFLALPSSSTQVKLLLILRI